MLEDVSRAARLIADTTAASVVHLDEGHRGASAIIISEGRLLTNAHNVRGDVLSMRTIEGRVCQARVAGVDVDGDVAVLEGREVGPPITFSPDPVTIGAPVFAVALARGGPRVTFGLVSSVGVAFRGPRGRRIGGSIEHTAPLAPGSSGSALVDLAGRLVGINTHRLGSGFYLAMPSDESLRARVEKLAAGERIERPRLGIAVAPSWVAQRMRRAVGLAPREGLLVREVGPDTPASEAGIEVGDLLVAVDDRPVSEPDDLADAIGGAPGVHSLGIVRGETELTLPVRLIPG
jgi:serine protease Do